MESIQSLAAALRAGRALPWALAGAGRDALGEAWAGSDDAAAMATVVAYLRPGRFAGAVAEAAADIPLEYGDAARAAVHRLYAVITAHEVVGPAAAADELRAALAGTPAGLRERVRAALCEAVRRAVPVLSSREVISAVSAR